MFVFLQQNVLADLAVESEAATLFTFRCAKAFDDANADPESEHYNAFARIATAVCVF